ncbi:mannitol dehydrogenase family protein [Novosphingobium sp. 1949]|uniref:Mannitol dehydrogenase family protein n=1 Tax=Novosphingobium organovorum TaxID=2930092 RepID=A0ABT0BHW7_9SPHN|nr:mannitol dehydrogenase family protein [Novosphingobium organovorum]MCJ2184319.1 mannitol dehydrogenase family protein [Novosphingobium organovorum]
MDRLSAAALGRLEGIAWLPAYARAAVRGGVVHFGIGAFHRAHQALVFEAMLAAGDPRWGVTGVSLRSAGVRDQLAAQDGLYTVLVREGAAQAMQVVGAVRSVLVAPEDPEAVVAALAAPDTFLVTLTVTEKGYCLDRASGTLDTAHRDVAADLASLERPRTAAGFLVAGLARRKRLGLGPLTLLSCDNLPHNGALLARSVLAMARAHDAELAAWIAENCRFPASMVDRIVPATTPEDIADLAVTTGLEDRAMVKTEPFLQWVIEDSFVGESPAFPVPGVILTRDVAPWEAAKLRLLNGAHSAIAYLGGLAGDAFVHDFVASPTGRRYLDRLWDELVPTLTLPEGFDPGTYRAQLMARFANSALQHRTTQIAMDGSQKLPQRLLAPLAERARCGADFVACALAVAGWVRWQAGRSDAGEDFAIDDPAAAVLAGALAGACDPRTRVEAALGVLDFRPDAAVCAVIAGHLEALERGGVRATLDEFVGEPT